MLIGQLCNNGSHCHVSWHKWSFSTGCTRCSKFRRPGFNPFRTWDTGELSSYGTSSKELSDKLNNDLVGVAKWLHDHKLTLNLDKTKCMLIGSNRKRESKVDLTVSILDHNINNVRSFKYLCIHASSDFTWTDHIEHLTGKVNQRLGLLKRIKHLLPFRARLLFYKSLVKIGRASCRERV